MAINLKLKLKNVPQKPGVYLFKNAGAEVLYVGKAHNLKNRLSQYFQKNHDGRPQIPFLMQAVADFDYIVTDNDIESLFLENNLIKKHMPRFNIKLRDDKNYAFIKIDYQTEIPQIYTIRNPDTKNAKYFGPYSSAHKVRETLQLLRKIFHYCGNAKISNKPCFYFHLHRCPGICVGKISLEEYQATIDKIALFLSGNISAVKKDVQKQMLAAARTKKFETAAELRNQLRSLAVIEERQKIIFAQKVNWDFISLFQTIDKAAINVFVIRAGKMIDRKNFIMQDTDNQNAAEIISAFAQSYYLRSADLPAEVYLEALPKDLDLLLTSSGKKLKIAKPRRGKKSALIKLGRENAKEFFESWTREQAGETARSSLALAELKKILKLEKLPARIECFDISNIQGTNSVASMVVFENGKAKKSDYRKFKIKNDGQPNDFAMMRETLLRRFSLAHLDGTLKAWPLPDLLVIDGGKGQLGVAMDVLDQQDLQIPTIGLAKREEEIFVPGKAQALRLPESNYALQLLQRLRDEAHRFAITFHKKLRAKQAQHSRLDEISGIGAKKKKLLLNKYGSIKNIKRAEEKELRAMLGARAAGELIKNI